MIKYHVKFTHQYIVPTVVSNSSYNDVRIIEVDTEWEFEDWVNVFSYIYGRFDVISDVTVTTIKQSITKTHYRGKLKIKNINSLEPKENKNEINL